MLPIHADSCGILERSACLLLALLQEGMFLGDSESSLISASPHLATRNNDIYEMKG